MNPIGKKFISLLLVFSLMILSLNLYAKERRGAQLIIIKKDGQQIEGELIAVKPKSLLLLNPEGRDVSVGIEDIEAIRIVKKSKVLFGSGLGLLIGGGSGLVIGALSPESDTFGDLTLIVGFLFGVPATLLGGLIGLAVGADTTILIEGMNESEIQETLDKLRKKARVRDYEPYLRSKPKIERKEVKDTLQTVKKGDIIPLGSVDIPPDPIKKVIPKYPRSAKRMKIEGAVVINALISEKGEVLSTYILKGIKGSFELNEAARKAVQQWIFMPAMKDGVLVKVWKQITIKFGEK